jgi:hypothetical protein
MKTKKKEDAFPGYPHYPESEDITNREKEVDADIEKLTRSHKPNEKEIRNEASQNETEDATPEIVSGTEADVTEEDITLLGDKDRDMDEGEDELILPSILTGPDVTGEDLDAPGADDNDPDIDPDEDEENNLYSRGQD